MANTTVKGAQSIHGRNPQARSLFHPKQKAHPKPGSRWECHSQPHLRVSVLERTLLCFDRCSHHLPTHMISNYNQPLVLSTKQSSCKLSGAFMETNDPLSSCVCSWSCFKSNQRKRSSLSIYRQKNSSKLIFNVLYDPSELQRYLRALAAMYVRLTFHAAEVYSVLEGMMKDYRKIRVRNTGKRDRHQLDFHWCVSKPVII